MEIILFFGATRSGSILDACCLRSYLVASRYQRRPATRSPGTPTRPSRQARGMRAVSFPPSQTLALERTKQGVSCSVIVLSFFCSPAPVLSCLFSGENLGMLLQLGRPARSQEGWSGRSTRSELKRWIDVGGVRGRHLVS